MFTTGLLYDFLFSIRIPVINQGPVLDNFLVIGSLFSGNITSKSFSRLNFLYILVPHKLKYISIVFLSCIFLALEVEGVLVGTA